jgi:hypothetical protein
MPFHEVIKLEDEGDANVGPSAQVHRDQQDYMSIFRNPAHPPPVSTHRSFPSLECLFMGIWYMDLLNITMSAGTSCILFF